jgi:hypothetical protein
VGQQLQRRQQVHKFSQKHSLCSLHIKCTRALIFGNFLFVLAETTNSLLPYTHWAAAAAAANGGSRHLMLPNIAHAAFRETYSRGVSLPPPSPAAGAQILNNSL